MTTQLSVIRTPQGLVEAMFDAIDRLNKKEIDSEHARALSHSARTIVQIARLELEYRQYAGNEGPDRLKLLSLAMDSKKAVP